MQHLTGGMAVGVFKKLPHADGHQTWGRRMPYLTGDMAVEVRKTSSY
jgi:hypothetical protein